MDYDEHAVLRNLLDHLAREYSKTNDPVIRELVVEVTDRILELEELPMTVH